MKKNFITIGLCVSWFLSGCFLGVVFTGEKASQAEKELQEIKEVQESVEKRRQERVRMREEIHQFSLNNYCK